MKPSEVLSKLRLDASMSVLILNAPKEYKALLKEVRFDSRVGKKEYDFVQVFASSHAELEKVMADAAESGKYDCLFWACYPKGGGRIKSDINRNSMWKAIEQFGLRPVSQISIDDTWSAMRLRPTEAVGK